MAAAKDLPGFNRRTAFNGALRFVDPHLSEFVENLSKDFGTLAPHLQFFAEDAFGTLYGLRDGGTVAIFWPETAEWADLGISTEEFYQAILDDPDGTIEYALYVKAVKRLGRPDIHQHFAFTIDTAFGGEFSVENISIMDSKEHLTALGSIARQIHEAPVGTKFKV